MDTDNQEHEEQINPPKTPAPKEDKLGKKIEPIKQDDRPSRRYLPETHVPKEDENRDRLNG